MKAYLSILTVAAFSILLLNSCKTKKQVASHTNISMDAQANNVQSDSIKNDVARLYYYPYSQSKFDSIKLAEKPTSVTTKNLYELAFQELKDMLDGKAEPNFERAVFISENPYYDGQFIYPMFQQSITGELLVIQNLIEANDQSDSIDFDVKVNENGRFKLADIRYLPKEKKELYRKALSNWAIFKYLTDTVSIYTKNENGFFMSRHAPHSYSTEDPFGMKDWTNAQVINLLASNENNSGNCFALAALFKIFSDRLNADARICTAPQHIYIQHRDQKGQYYNVELATAGHPGDGIIQTLTYTPSEAIVSGIALRDYTTKQSIGLCMVNLAKSYEHKFNTKDDEFMLRCADLALEYDSLNLNALLLKAQVLDYRTFQYAKAHRIGRINQLKRDSVIAPTVLRLEKHLALIQHFGYRQMPLEMQERIMNPLKYDVKKWDRQSRNPRPFASFEPKDPKDAEYWTLTKGAFQEVFEPTKKETYGHFTISTSTKALIAMDTTDVKGALIDPVAFAYDFGARIYDARIGHFVSTDPLEAKYPYLSPYAFAANNPIYFVDPDGRDIMPTTKFLASSWNPVLENLKANNTVFNLLAGGFMNSKKYNVTLGVDPNKIFRNSAAWTTAQIGENEVFGIGTGKFLQGETNYRPSSGKNMNDLGKAAIIIHEFVHLYIAKQSFDNDEKLKKDEKHEDWDDYMYLMQQGLAEYSRDNNLGLKTEQIYEISVVSAGSGTTVFTDYVKKMADQNETTVEVESDNLRKRVSDLTAVTQSEEKD
jgi:RHS repeat-associated protein